MSEAEQTQGSTGRLLAGRYRLGKVLGRGGMGTVWRAVDETLGRTVAVKEVRFSSNVDEDEKQRLITRTLREAKAIARVRSSGAVTVYDVVDEDDRPWIVMELIEGGSLAEVVRDKGRLTPHRAAEVGLAVLDVLRAAHREGILHRDVKPSNVLMAEDGRVVLTDFGIAQVEGDPSVTSTGMLVGAPSYIAPERARGHRPGPPADLWSLGGLLYACVEGVPPYDKGSALATLTAVMTEPLERPKNAGPLEEVIYGLLAKDPAQRLDDAGARALLTEALDAQEEHGTPAPAEPVDATRTMALPPVPVPERDQTPEREQEPGPRREPEREPTAAAGAADASSAAGAAGAANTAQAAQSVDAAAAGQAQQETTAEPAPAYQDQASGARAGAEERLRGALRAVRRAAGAASGAAAGAAASRSTASGSVDSGSVDSGSAESPSAASPSAGSASGGAVAGSAVAPGGPRRAASAAIIDAVPRRALVVAAAVVALALIGTVLAFAFGKWHNAGGANGQGAEATSTAAGPGAGTSGDDSGADDRGKDKAANGADDTAGADEGGSGKSGEDSSGEGNGKKGAPKTGKGPIPNGFARLADSQFHFSMALPAGWRRTGVAGQSSGGIYSMSGGFPRVQVDFTSQPGSDAVAAWRQNEPAVRRSSSGYRSLFIKKVDYRGYPTVADWSFVRDQGGQRVRVLNRGFKVDGSHGYSIMITCRAADWGGDRCSTIRDTAFQTFRPKD